MNRKLLIILSVSLVFLFLFAVVFVILSANGFSSPGNVEKISEISEAQKALDKHLEIII